LIPAAIEAMRISLGFNTGTSTSSTWKAVLGSPNRSERITWANIRLGTSPMGGNSLFTPVLLILFTFIYD
jgi:hypothetical protein